MFSTKSSLLVSLLLASFVSISLGESAHCEYSDDYFYGYSCRMSNGFLDQEFDDFVIIGEHLEGRTDADVLAILQAQNNSMRFVPPSLTEIFPNIRIFRLFNVGLEHLTVNSFRNCANLTEIELYWNHIEDIPNGVMNHCTNLVEINVYSNLIRDLDENAFQGLVNVQSINLNSNRLQTIPTNLFASQTNLRELHLYGNEIETIAVNAFANLANIQYLDLERNNLTEIGDVFGEASSLVNVHIGYNNFTNGIPRLNLPNLRSLWLVGNNFTEILNNTFDLLPSIEVLDFERNQIRSIPADAFEGLEHITTLYFEYNSVEAIDYELIDRVQSLRGLWLSGNLCVSRNFYDVHDDREDTEFAFETCYYNFMEPSPIDCTFTNDDIYGYTCVVSDISFHNFRDKFSLVGEHTEGLTDANVYGIRILSSNFNRVPATVFRSFPNLAYLQIEGVSEIRENTFEICPQLRVLDLSNNNIRRLPRQAFTNCNWIDNLILDNNPIVGVQPTNNNLFRNYIRNLSMRNNVCVNGAYTNLWSEEDPAAFNQCFGFWFLTL